MRLASMLLVAACLALSAHADGKPRRAQPAGPSTSAAPAPLDRRDGPSGPARSLPIGYEIETYRFGGTYAAGPGTTVQACEAACGEDLACKAWSFIDAYGSAQARCEMKRSAGRAEENLLATSGLSPALKAGFLGTPAVADPVDRSQLIGDANSVAAPKDIRLMASVPVLTYRPVEPLTEATQTSAGIQLPVTQPSISFTPVATVQAAPERPALRYSSAETSVTRVQTAKDDAPEGAKMYYPGKPQGEGEAETGGKAYYPLRKTSGSPAT